MADDATHGRQRGFGNAERPVTEELWRRDTQPSLAMAENGNHEPSRRHVDYRRYYDVEYAQREIDKIWMKSWLYAAREEDLPNVGDRMPFQVGRRSFLLVRVAEDVFKAFYNSCPHRGAELCSRPENGERIVCPFHGWQFKNDGALSHIPSHWDFTSVTRQNGGLEEVRLARWGGFLFVNADQDAPPLEAALGVMPRHFSGFAPENRYTAGHFRRLMPANWKIVQEAFLEAYHVVGTHPETIPFNGDTQSQYDVWSSEHGHVGRMVTPSAVPSMSAGPEASVFDAATALGQFMVGWLYPDEAPPVLDPNADLRAQLGGWHRQVYERTYGPRAEASDAEMLDSILYSCFPNFTLWLSELIPLAYQFLPHETDPELSYFDVRLLKPVPAGQPRPPPSTRTEIGVDEWVDGNAPAFGLLASIFDQDLSNMPRLQRGIRSASPQRAYSTLGEYQELIIQHWHDVHDALMAR